VKRGVARNCSHQGEKKRGQEKGIEGGTANTIWQGGAEPWKKGTDVRREELVKRPFGARGGGIKGAKKK